LGLVVVVVVVGVGVAGEEGLDVGLVRWAEEEGVIIFWGNEEGGAGGVGEDKDICWESAASISKS